jgi:uncharacterized Tic20 family protein
VGTRYEDQPPEVWADPDSLDPTPVWKQFLLIGLLLLPLIWIGSVILMIMAAIAANNGQGYTYPVNIRLIK